MERLLGHVDLSHRGRVHKAAIAASQLDWKELQQRHAGQWSSLVSHTFGTLDTDHDGLLKASDIIEVTDPVLGFPALTNYGGTPHTCVHHTYG